jgi:beta-glucanase (GH16 family)
MRFNLFLFIIFSFPIHCFAQKINDDFEGNGNITSWAGDDCAISTQKANPYAQGINTSSTVLSYTDNGGVYANVRFDLNKNLDLSVYTIFTFKIYVASANITGNQTNQVSLKLQDGTLPQPWSTQTEIIKPLLINQWQTVTFDFAKDPYINLNGGSTEPKDRKDFNRILIQVNGENNTDKVVAYIDDFNYNFTSTPKSVYTQLVWSDEFNYTGAIDSSKWHHQTLLPISGSWYNGEIQHYTNRIDNSIVKDGSLKIIAKKENFSDQGFTKTHTSARLNSKFAFKFGRLVVRAKLPSGLGTWPAIWMLGKNIDENGAYWDNKGYGTTTWPACGEIDIMEHWGSNQNYVQSAIHTPSSFGGTINLGGQTIPTASSAFHVYEFEWTPEKLIFSVDSVVHYTYKPSIKNASTWPFNNDQYLLLNIAIQPSISSGFTQGSMDLDYVRIYQLPGTAITSIEKSASSNAYPNPFSEQFTIQLAPSDASTAQIKMYSIDGQLMVEKTCKINDNAIIIENLSAFANGIYYVSIFIDGQMHCLKVNKI